MDEEHLPLKDEFSNDLSDIDFGEKDDEANLMQKELERQKKIKKKQRLFTWEYRWVRSPNAVSGSAPLYMRKWVKIKRRPVVEPPVEGQEKQQKVNQTNKNFSLAEAIIKDQNRDNPEA